MTPGKQENCDPQSLVQDHDLNEHMASLRYAGLIQHALMPNPEVLKGYLKDFFVLFLPRDVVSGDFYYAFCNRQKMCIAVGDCTGHGVPGALMSILGISILNEIMQSGVAIKANRILNMMREKIMNSLNQKGNSTENKDSIDIALCLVDCATGLMQFSGANRPLIMIREGELTEYKPDKMTLGVNPVREASFTNTSIETKPGDSFYLFSDGYSDQFGGFNDKKFKYKHLKRIIHSNEILPMTQQKQILESTFKEWKGTTHQVDDVLVFGFQL